MHPTLATAPRGRQVEVDRRMGPVNSTSLKMGVLCDPGGAELPDSVRKHGTTNS